MRVYHFVNRKFGIQDLQRRRLKVARIADLNDPFEMIGPMSRDREIRATFEMIKAVFSAYIGVTCFSKSWSNPVHWSHYADGHHGLCLGFDVPDTLLRRVTYHKNRISIDLSALKSGLPSAMRELEKLLTAKYAHWQYEDEVRSFVSFSQCRSERGRHFLPFSNAMDLKEVIVGHRCALTRAELDENLGDLVSRTVVAKARLAFQSFRVVRQLNAEVWQ